MVILEASYEKWLSTPASLLWLDVLKTDSSGFRYIRHDKLDNLYYQKIKSVDEFKLIPYDVIRQQMGIIILYLGK